MNQIYLSNEINLRFWPNNHLNPISCYKKNTVDWVDYKQQKVIFYSPGGWESKIRVPAWLGSGEGPLPGYILQTSFCILLLGCLGSL